MTLPTVQIEFLGDGAEPTTVLDVSHIAEYPRGADGMCAYCQGDPCAETSPPESLIAKYFARFDWVGACPCCDGRPT